MKPLLVLFSALCLMLVGGSPIRAENPVQDDPDAYAPQADDMVWELTSAGLESPFALWFSPEFAAHGQIYAAMDHTLWDVGYGYGVIYRSDDRGVTWQAASPGDRRFMLAAFAPTAGTPPILALETYYNASWQQVNRLVRSTTGGAAWVTVWDDCPLFSALVFSPDFTHDGTVFAVWDDSAAGGLWKSTDGGVTWHPNQKIQVHPDNGRIVSLVFSPAYAADHTLLASALPHTSGGVTYPGGVYRSENHGDAWAKSDSGCIGAVTRLAFSPSAAADHTVYAIGSDVSDAANGRVYRSTSDGRGWTCLAAQPVAGALFDVALSLSFAADQTVVLATAHGLVRSTNNGASWSPLAWGNAAVQRVVLSPAYPQDHTLSAAMLDGQPSMTYPGGVFLSRNGGATWQTAGIARMPVKTLALSPEYAANHTLWAASGDGSWAAYRSTDGARTWLKQVNYNVGAWVGFSGLAAAPGPGGAHEVYGVTPIGGPSAGFYQSANNGEYFTLLPGGPQYGNVIAVSTTPNGTDSVWVGNYEGPYRSHTGGATWALRNGNLPAGTVVSLGVASGSNIPDTEIVFVVLSGPGAGAYRSVDSGGHWTALALPGGATAQYVALSPAYLTDRTLWVSTATGGVLRSFDGGASWHGPATTLSGCGPVRVTGASPDRRLWAACGGSLFTSADDGAAWTAAGPGGVSVASVATSPTTETVYLGTNQGGGIWRGRPDDSTGKAVYLPMVCR